MLNELQEQDKNLHSEVYEIISRDSIVEKSMEINPDKVFFIRTDRNKFSCIIEDVELDENSDPYRVIKKIDYSSNDTALSLLIEKDSKILTSMMSEGVIINEVVSGSSLDNSEYQYIEPSVIYVNLTLEVLGLNCIVSIGPDEEKVILSVPSTEYSLKISPNRLNGQFLIAAYPVDEDPLKFKVYYKDGRELEFDSEFIDKRFLPQMFTLFFSDPVIGVCLDLDLDNSIIALGHIFFHYNATTKELKHVISENSSIQITRMRKMKNYILYLSTDIFTPNPSPVLSFLSYRNAPENHNEIRLRPTMPLYLQKELKTINAYEFLENPNPNSEMIGTIYFTNTDDPDHLFIIDVLANAEPVNHFNTQFKKFISENGLNPLTKISKDKVSVKAFVGDIVYGGLTDMYYYPINSFSKFKEFDNEVVCGITNIAEDKTSSFTFRQYDDKGKHTLVIYSMLDGISFTGFLDSGLSVLINTLCSEYENGYKRASSIYFVQGRKYIEKHFNYTVDIESIRIVSDTAIAYTAIDKEGVRVPYIVTVSK